MLIGELAQAADMSRDTIRYYVRLGILKPQISAKGGRNPYKIFSQQDLETLRMLRVSKVFGMTLREFQIVRRDAGPDGLSKARRREVIEDRLAKLEAQAVVLNDLIRRLRDDLMAPGTALPAQGPQRG